MKKTIIISLVVLVLVVASVIVYNRLKPLEKKEITKTSSIQEIMLSNKPTKCTYVDALPDTLRVEGIVYIADNKIREDYNYISTKGTSQGHSLIKDMTSYSWGDENKKGSKILLTIEDQNILLNKSLDPNINREYFCTSWIKNNSYFLVPDDIEFEDYTDVVTDIKKEQAQYEKCSACDEPGLNREQCLIDNNCK